MSVPFRSFVHPLEIPRQDATVQELLDVEVGEEWIYGQHGVGLYEGNSKLPNHQILSVQLTTHRIILLATSPPAPTASTSSNPSDPPALSSNLQVSLSDIRQTEYYMGFIRSSAKITLFLGANPDIWGDRDRGTNGNGVNLPGTSTNTHPNGTPAASKEDSTWTCNVCGYSNPTPTFLSRSNTLVHQTPRCELCGVVKDLVKASSSSRPSTPTVGTNPSPTPKVPTTPRSDSPRTTNHPENNVGGEGFEIPCPRCTFLNRPELKRCEVCSGILVPRGATVLGSDNKVDGVIRTDSPVPNLPLPAPTPTTVARPGGSQNEMATLRISFRKGGEKEVYKRLRTVLSAKAWERARARGRGGGGQGGRAGEAGLAGGGGGEAAVRSGFGIDGILQNISLENKAQQGNVEDAFKDLEALMVRAGEMVKLVQTLNTKLTQQQANSSTGANGTGNGQSDDEATQTFLRSSLVQLGLPAPAITSDMVADERKYLEGLAKELGGLLTGKTGGREDDGLMVGKNGKGLVGMDEVWGLWNRARGVSLVSPSDFQKAIPLLASHTRPKVELMTFPTGLSVLHTPFYHPKMFSNRLVNQLTPTGSDGMEKAMSTVEIALTEGLSVGLAKELVYLVESQFGQVVRDEQAQEQGGGEKWYRNLINDTQLDDI